MTRSGWHTVVGAAVMLGLGAGLAAAQQGSGISQAPPQPRATQTVEREVRVFEVPPDRLQHIVRIMAAEYRSTNFLGDDAITVIGTPDELAAAARMIEKLSKEAGGTAASLQARLLISIVGANREGESGTMPDHLKDAVAELRGMFPYRGYQLLDMVPVVATPDQANGSLEAILPQCSPIPEAECQQKFTWAIDKSRPDGTLKLPKLTYWLSVPTKMTSYKGKDDDTARVMPQMQNSGLSTPLEIGKGQTVVVGKVNPGSKQDAIFVMVSRLDD